MYMYTYKLNMMTFDSCNEWGWNKKKKKNYHTIFFKFQFV